MLKKGFIITCLLFFLLASAKGETDTILNRYKQYLLASESTEGDVSQFAISLNAKGQWNDINYQDTEKANWKPLIHLQRARDMALVWANPKSQFYHQPALWKSINGALEHWFAEHYKSSNWWHNEIGVPRYIRDIIVLTKDQLSGQSLTQALKVMAQHRVQYTGVGANLTWSADLGFHYGALTNSRDLMQRCRNLLLKEIRITTEEGVQPDFSFHQHGKRLQMFQYGKAFLWENVRLAWQVRGTSFSFPDEQIKILSNFVLKGWQYMGRGIHTVPGTMDRSSSRINALQSADVRKLIPYLIQLRPDQKEQFEQLNTIQNGQSSLVGYRFFPYSDLTVYHQKAFSFFLKTISKRTLATESINNENLKGYLLNSGDAYLIKDGNEYFNLMPVWDWQHLPGVTTFKDAEKIEHRSFSGAVSNEKSGLTAMDYQLNGKGNSGLTTRKLWASHENLTVCLISEMKTDGVHTPIYTTLDQSRLRGNVTVNKVNNILKKDEHQLKDVQWIHHAGFAYIPLGKSHISLKMGEVNGSWSSINASLTASLITDQIFMPIIKHDLTDTLATGYVLSACNTPQDAQKLAMHPTWEVLRNDKDGQAVHFKDGTIMASFFSAGTLTVGSKDKLVVDKPCLVLISANRIYVSNPAHTQATVEVSWQNKIIHVNLKEDGTTTLHKIK